MRQHPRDVISRALQHTTKYRLAKMSGVSPAQIGRYMTKQHDIGSNAMYRVLCACDQVIEEHAPKRNEAHDDKEPDNTTTKEPTYIITLGESDPHAICKLEHIVDWQDAIPDHAWRRFITADHDAQQQKNNHANQHTATTYKRQQKKLTKSVDMSTDGR